MQPLRDLVLQRSWRRIAGRTPRRPQAAQRWDGDAHVLVLYDQDDPITVQRVRRLTLLDFGLSPGGSGSGSRGAALGLRPIGTLAYTAVPQPVAEHTHDLWSPKQLTFGGVATAEVMQPVLAKAYDLVVNLYPEPFAPFDYLSAQALAHLRIAGHDGAPGAYDVMINAGAGEAWPDGFVRAVADYLRAQNPHVYA